MTYRRDPGSFQTATTEALAICGAEALAAVLGTSEAWLRKYANPCGGVAISIERAVAADIATHARGAGCPHFEEMRRRLVAEGCLAPAARGDDGSGWALFVRAARPLVAAIAEAAGALARLLDAPESCAAAMDARRRTAPAGR